MSVRYRGAPPFSFQRAASQPGHLGQGAGFVDEDQAPWIEVRLGCEARLAGC